MSDHGSVLSWLENIQNPIAIRQDQYPYADRGTTAGKRKRSPEEDLSSRHASPRLRALAETSGNIMPNGNMEDSEDDLASTQHPQVSPAYKRQPRTTPSYPSTTRSRPRAGQDLQSLQSQRAGENQKAEIFQKAMGRNEERDAQNKADLGEATPGGLYFGKAFAPMLPRPQTRDMSISSPTHGSANEDLSSTRSRSPVKKMVDLSFAKRPTKYRDLDGRVAQNLGGVLDKYARLVKISRGEEVIPLQLKAYVESLLHEHDWPPKYYYTTTATADPSLRAYQASWPEKLQDMSEQARECVRESLSEASWNDMVHGNIIRLVTKSPRYSGLVVSGNITASQIQPRSLSPIHLAGNAMQTKLVDFAVYLRSEASEEERILQVIAKFPSDAQSINQTQYAPLRQRPIAISIETKPPFTGGETADVQLSIWAGAGLMKLTQLLELQGKDSEIPALPVLTFHGHDLYLSVIKGEGRNNNLHGQLPLGSTRTLVGAFQVVAALGILVDWANSDYRSWFESILT